MRLINCINCIYFFIPNAAAAKPTIPVPLPSSTTVLPETSHNSKKISRVYTIHGYTQVYTGIHGYTLYTGIFGYTRVYTGIQGYEVEKFCREKL